MRDAFQHLEGVYSNGHIWTDSLAVSVTAACLDLALSKGLTHEFNSRTCVLTKKKLIF